MARQFKTADYAAMLKQTVSIEECLPPTHLPRFIAQSIGRLDLSPIYQEYGPKGGTPIAPEILLGLLYGYATGVFSSRAIERATNESIPFRFLAGILHPDHDTIAHFRSRFLPQIGPLFVQVLEQAVAQGMLKVEDLSLDGTKIHADASKSKAVSANGLRQLQTQLKQEVDQLLAMGHQADSQPSGLAVEVDIEAEIALRHSQLEQLAVAQTVLEQRAKERYEQAQAEYEAKVAKRERYHQQTGCKPKGRAPVPPFSGRRPRPVQFHRPPIANHEK